MESQSFKKKFPLVDRKSEATRILKKYPKRVPVIVEKSRSSDINQLDKKKYLVPDDLTVGQFMYVIRKRLKLSPEKAMYMFTNNTLLPSASLITSAYDEYKDEDLFLYFTYSSESTFG